jgi:hypothetical protein
MKSPPRGPLPDSLGQSDCSERPTDSALNIDARLRQSIDVLCRMSGLPLALTVKAVEISDEGVVLSDRDRYYGRQWNFATALQTIWVCFFRETAGGSHE